MTGNDTMKAARTGGGTPAGPDHNDLDRRSVMADDNHTSSGALEVEGFTPYAQIPVWILRKPDLSLGSKALYGALMTYADNRTKLAFPGQEQVASDLGCTVRTVYKYMKELEESGILSVERRRNKQTGNFYANHYVLRFADPSESTFRPAVERAFRVTRPTNLTTPPEGAFAPPVAQGDLALIPAPPESEVAAESTGKTPSQLLLGEWLDHCDVRPPKQVITRTGKELKALIDEGFTADQIRPGLQRWSAKGLSPAALAGVVNECLNSHPERVINHNLREVEYW